MSPIFNWKNKIDIFNKRWNISVADNSTETFTKFKTRVLSTFADIENHIMTPDIRTFCKIFGIAYDERHTRYVYILNAIKNTSSLTDLCLMLEVIFAFDIYDNSRYVVMERHNKGWYLKETKEIFEISGIQTRIIESASGEIFIVPSGEKKLDEELVNPVLSFLQSGSNKHFISALQFYEQKKWVNCAESLRRSLEEYLREKLENNIGLQANISEISKKLKNQKSPAQTRNIVATNFGHLNQFFNENSKHGDGDLEESDAEFLIYQIALLMKYIEKYI